MKKSHLFLLFLILALGTLLPAQTIVNIGYDSTVNTTSGTPTPYGTYYKNFRQQYLYTAAEIENAGGGAGPIQSIAFNVQVLNNCSPMPNFTIKMKNTTQTVLTTTFEVGDYTTVFVQDNFMPVEGWNTHTLIQPYQWDGASNILIDLSCTFVDTYTQNASVYYTATTGVNTCLRYQSDSVDANTSATGTVSANRANIKFNMTAATVTTPPNSTNLVSPLDGATNQALATTLNWSPGTGLPSGYKVHFGTTNPPPFVEDVGSELSYEPDLAYDTTYYWKIVPYNSMGDATNCPVWSFSTLPEGLVYIGDGTTTGIYLPVNTLYGYSYSQTVYLQNEINVQNQRIEKISYYWPGTGSAVNNNSWTIYMGHTDQSSFNATTDWVPYSQLTQVYTGIVDFPTAAGWMEIVLTNPFVYNNTQNLVICTLENSPGYTSGGTFLNTVAPGRSIRAYSDSIIPDPTNPPSGASQVLQGHHPNIILQFGDLPDGPVLSYHPASFDFGLLMQGNPSDWRNLMITNTGAGNIALNATNISIIGPDAAAFEFDGVNLPANLGSGISVNIPVRATVDDEGEVSATLRITWGGNNYDVALTAEGLPGGMVIIGDGVVTTRYPLGCYYGHERSASLYLANEIGIGNKRINTLAWYATQALTQGIPTTIYLKSYGGNTLSADTWANHILGATPVYNGTDTPVNANEWHAISLDNTFDLDSGDNLLVLVERNHGGSGAGAGSAVPAVYGTTLTGMHHTVQADTNPPSGNTAAQTSRPNLMLFADNYDITDPPNPAIVISPQNGATMVAQNPTLSWASGGGGPTGYKLHFGTTNPPPFVEDLGGVQSYDASNLIGETTYYWQIIPYNANGEATACPVWSFSTVPDGLVYIGEGTTTQRQPFGALYGYERSASLYTQAEIGTIGNLMFMGWNCSNTGTNGSAALPFKIYLKTTDNNTVTPTPWNTLISDATLVKEGTHTFNSLGWHSFNLDIPYLYTGGNLMVLVETNYGGSGASGMYPSFYYTSGAAGTHLYYNTDTNPPTTNGTNNALRPNIMLQLGALTGDPHLITSPDQYDFGTVILGYAKTKGFTLANGGGGELTVNSINLSGNQYFSLSNLPTLPLTLSTGHSAHFDLNYNPVTAGEHNATITITDNTRQAYTIPISALGFDTTITEFSHLENFDSVTIPELPLGWSSIYQASVTTGYVKTIATSPYSAPNCVTMYNPTDINTIAILVAPPLSTDVPANNIRVRFMGKGSTNYAVRVGVMTDPEDASTFVELGIHTFTSTWAAYEQSLGSYTGTGRFIAFKHACNAATQTLYLDDIEFEMMGENDLAAIRVTGNSIPSVGMNTPYTITVLNNGTAPQSVFTIKLFDMNHVELASTAGVNINPGISQDFTLNWTPQTQGPTSIYGKVFLADDINPGNDSTPLKPIAVQPEGVITVTIGEGTENGRMPLDFFYKNSINQSMYYPAELGMIGNITAISLYNNFVNNLTDKPVKIWLGSTDEADLSTDWMPGDDMTLVFDGVMNFPSGENTITFPLQTIFPYTSGNLVVMFNRPMDTGYHSSTDYFKTQTGTTGRARNMFSDSVEYDPNNLTAGTVTGVHPRISFSITPMTGEPVCLIYPESHDFGDVNIGVNSIKSFNIINAGGGNLVINNITITGSPAMTLSNLPTLPVSLSTGESSPFAVSYMPTELGADTATVYVTDNLGTRHAIGQLNSRSDRSVHSIQLTGNGVHDITVGNGSVNARVPLDFYYKNSLYENIYTTDEINNFAGLVTGIKLYTQFTTNLTNKPVKLWLGSTQQTDLNSGWIPATQLTQVFDGTMDFPNGQNVIVFEFPVPYLHPGGNLVLMANRPMDTGYHSSTDYFKTQTGTTGRAREMHSDSVVYNPDAPDAGTLTGAYPMITFQVLTGGSGSLIGTVTSGATPLEGVLIEVVDEVYSTHTNASGQFGFPFVIAGNYNLRAHKIGYEDHVLPITIVEDEQTIVNINMTESATVQVTGSIVGSDNPGVGLSEAEIYLIGPINYNGVSDANGQFVIPNVLSGNTFNYSIMRAGYQAQTGTIVVGSTDYSMGTITLLELTLPPSAITAEVNAAETAVMITWRPPGQGGSAMSFDFENNVDGEWEPSGSWGDGTGDWEYTSNYNVANFVDSYGSASVIPPPNAHSGTGMWGTKINTNYTNAGGFSFLSKTFNFSGLSNAQISFWSWENLFGDWDYAQLRVNGNLEWGPSWDYTNTQWQNRIVDLSAYDGLNEVEIIFEMYATTTVNYAGWYIDDIEIGSGNRLATTSSASVLPEALRGLSEPEAAAMAESLAQRSPAPVFTQSQSTRSESISRIPVGYHVYKLMAGQEQQQAQWTQLTTASITDTSFTHAVWQDLPNGLHKWAVKTVYTGGVLSDPGFSNNLRKWPTDMSALSIQGNTTPTVGAMSNYIVTVKNTGTSFQPAGAYTVKIMSGNNELASVPGPAINPNQSLEVSVPWTPANQGTMQIYGKVVLPGDLTPDNDSSDTITVLVMPAGQFGYTIGEGDQNALIPINMFYKASISQTMYYPAELGNFYGFFTGIQYYNNFVTSLMDKPIQIWIGTTTLDNLSAAFVPVDATHTLVFDGNLNFPSGENTITIPFIEPYMYMNGENILVTVVRPLDGAYYSSTDYFKCQTIGSNRNRRTQSDTVAYDAANPPASTTLSGQFPKTTFLGIPGGVGTFQGVVNGPNNQPLQGVTVALIDAGYTTTTAADGSYQIQYILTGDYDASFSRHGYITQLHEIEIEEDETTTLNVTMQLMPQVTVSGTVLASDTSQGIAGAHIILTGYDDYSGTSIANGTFAINDVFAGHTYQYIISATGYTTITGTVEVGNTNLNMGNLILNEVAYAPNSVIAALNATYDAVQLNWNAPDPNAVEIVEGFESNAFPPDGWSQTVTNTGAANALGVYPTWCNFGAINVSGSGTISPTEGSKQAGLRWDYNHQDEWLKTPSFNCPPDAYLSFDTYVTNGSDGGDHYYVKVSTNGGSSWIALWDASTLPSGTNSYDTPINIDLSNYAGTEIILAFQAEDPPSNDGLHHDWFIDKIYIGNMTRTISFAGSELISAAKAEPVQILKSTVNESAIQSLQTMPEKVGNRALVGYKVWRLATGQENNESTWISLTDDLLQNASYEDADWNNIPNGSYKWAVKAVYTADVISASAFSNPLVKEVQNGNIVGFVRRENGQGIAGALVSAGESQATTNAAGAYSLVLPVGVYSVTAVANGFHPNTMEGIVVAPNQNTTVNFIMIPTSNEDELIPVTITQLNGNYPNPFNPETTISYDLKDACPVSLEIYNLRGQLVRTLVKDTQASGRYRLVFDARDRYGNALSSGVYFYRFTAGEYTATRKMLLME